MLFANRKSQALVNNGVPLYHIAHRQTNRERERETHSHTHTHTEREREREEW